MNRRAFLRFLGLAPVALPVLASMPAAEPSIDFSEGLSPGAVNNSARGMVYRLGAWERYSGYEPVYLTPGDIYCTEVTSADG